MHNLSEKNKRYNFRIIDELVNKFNQNRKNLEKLSDRQLDKKYNYYKNQLFRKKFVENDLKMENECEITTCNDQSMKCEKCQNSCCERYENIHYKLLEMQHLLERILKIDDLVIKNKIRKTNKSLRNKKYYEKNRDKIRKQQSLYRQKMKKEYIS